MVCAGQHAQEHNEDKAFRKGARRLNLLDEVLRTT
jgi:hypothetical protein